jgi:adenylate cyclase class IV
MASPEYEIEIKSLLGEEGAADSLRAKLARLSPPAVQRSSYTQLNHYFEGGEPLKLVERLAAKLPAPVVEKMRTMAEGKQLSVRTRAMNGEARIVMKASIGDDSSENGVMRMEIEEPVPGLSLDALDEEVLAAGYTYQAKWSRSREEYRAGECTICLDKNAGYGYVAEFEKVVPDAALAEGARREIEAFMASLGLSELAQDRLERMFAFYNEHWPEYYGTDKIFVID